MQFHDTDFLCFSAPLTWAPPFRADYHSRSILAPFSRSIVNGDRAADSGIPRGRSPKIAKIAESWFYCDLNTLRLLAYQATFRLWLCFLEHRCGQTIRSFFYSAVTCSWFRSREQRRRWSNNNNHNLIVSFIVMCCIFLFDSFD